MPGIFISYRRDDSFAYAGRIYDHLATHFGEANVFMDVDNIPPGLDFVDVLQQKVSSCDVLLVIVGKRWLSIADDRGRRRLDDAEDLLVVEIGAALRREIPVIPIIVGGASMPRAQELPDAIRSFSRRNALEISDLAFHEGVNRLIQALDRIVPKAAPLETVTGEKKSLHPAAIPPPTEIKAAPVWNVPRWRKWLLFYRPHGALSWKIFGWLFRIIFWICGAFCLIATIVYATDDSVRGDDDFLGTIVFYVIVTVLAGLAVRWCDRRAARKPKA